MATSKSRKPAGNLDYQQQADALRKSGDLYKPGPAWGSSDGYAHQTQGSGPLTDEDRELGMVDPTDSSKNPFTKMFDPIK